MSHPEGIARRVALPNPPRACARASRAAVPTARAASLPPSQLGARRELLVNASIGQSRARLGSPPEPSSLCISSSRRALAAALGARRSRISSRLGRKVIQRFPAHHALVEAVGMRRIHIQMPVRSSHRRTAQPGTRIRRLDIVVGGRPRSRGRRAYGLRRKDPRQGLHHLCPPSMLRQVTGTPRHGRCRASWRSQMRLGRRSLAAAPGLHR